MLGGAWMQYLLFGLPSDPSVSLPPATETTVKGFPVWLILCHWVNFFLSGNFNSEWTFDFNGSSPIILE